MYVIIKILLRFTITFKYNLHSCGKLRSILRCIQSITYPLPNVSFGHLNGEYDLDHIVKVKQLQHLKSQHLKLYLPHMVGIQT